MLESLVGNCNGAHVMAQTTERAIVRPKGHLLRILGVGFGIAVIVGGALRIDKLRGPDANGENSSSEGGEKCHR
jgi:hypothetical protein